MTLAYFSYEVISVLLGLALFSPAVFHVYLLWLQIGTFFVFGLGLVTIHEMWFYLILTAVCGAIIGYLIKKAFTYPTLLGWYPFDLAHALNEEIDDQNQNREPGRKMPHVQQPMYWFRFFLFMIVVLIHVGLWEVITHNIWGPVATLIWWIASLAISMRLLHGTYVFFGQVPKDPQGQGGEYVPQQIQAGNMVLHLYAVIFMAIIAFGVVRVLNSTFWGFYLGLIVNGAALVWIIIWRFAIVRNKVELAGYHKAGSA